MHSFLLIGLDCSQKIHQLLDEHHIAPPDVFSVADNPITIKTIRELKIWASRKPFQSPTKAAVIYNAHNLTLPAQNALLKTLEEPPQDTIVILTTPNPSLLLDTILSRCQIIITNHYPLTTSHSPEIDKLLKSLPSLSPAQRLIKAAEYSKTRDQAVSFVDPLIATLRQQSDPHLRLVYETHKHLKANVNPRLCLEHLFLSW